MKKYASLMALVTLLCAMPALAEDTDKDNTIMRPSPLPGKPAWLSGMFSYTMPDEDRGTEDGYGGTFGLGRKFSNVFAVELNGFYTQMDPTLGSGSAMKFGGGGVSLMMFPITRFPDVYGLVGVGYGQATNHPGPVDKYDSIVYETGLGWFFPVWENVMLRADARLRMDTHDNDKTAGTTPGENRSFYDGVYSVGLAYAWGMSQPVAEEPAKVVDTGAMDSDNDGVPDAMDKCPGTPAGAVVNADGCEADEDGDGVPDRIDQCPGTPPGTAVNDVGCPLDSDGDGVPDNIDECPNTPLGTKVLPNGCALKADCRKPNPGEQVDENGCAVEQTNTLRGVNFEFDSDRLTEEAKVILNDVAVTLKAEPNVKVEVRGHTDFIGTDEYNQGLSERRAASAKRYLVEQGVEDARMSTIGFGESQPVDPAQTDEARARNRRVELKVLN
ncbi:MAG TPA: OmpA family protein [Solimonas sp.]|nr:OmpA family protein [Solimonas sp.]